jgi:hypothetical protein
MSITLCFEVSVVFIASVSGTRLLENGFDRFTTDTIGFLIREFEFSYVATRFQFFSGLLSFFFAVSLRTWATFHGSFGSAMALGIITFALNMVTYFNESVSNYRFGLLGYAIRLVQLSFSRRTFTPVRCVSSLAFFGFLYYQYKAIRGSRALASMAPGPAATDDEPGKAQINRYDDGAAKASPGVASGPTGPVTTTTPAVTIEVAAAQQMNQEDYCDVTLSSEWCT